MHYVVELDSVMPVLKIKLYIWLSAKSMICGRQPADDHDMAGLANILDVNLDAFIRATEV